MTQSKALEKEIHKDSSITTRTLANKLGNIDINISYRIVGRHLNNIGFVKSLSLKTPILTNKHKKAQCWHKGQCPIRCVPKDRTKLKEFYVKIVRKHLPEVKKMIAFLHNNVPELMNWPSVSSDLNPIENLWCIVKSNVEKRMLKNLDEL
ncbi:7083_t:CDS:2, partial [Scutellospora calospora]